MFVNPFSQVETNKNQAQKAQSSKETFPENLERLERFNIGGFEFPLLGTGDYNSRRLAAKSLLQSDVFSQKEKLFTPLLYSDADVNLFKELINNPKKINEEFDLLEKLIINMQIYKKNQAPSDLRYPNAPNLDEMSYEKRNKFISANPGLDTDAKYFNVKIEDSKLFNLLTPLQNKFLFEGLGQNIAHKWDLMNHTRNVLLNSHKLANNENDDLINELKNSSSKFKNIIEKLSLSDEDKENLFTAGLFHDLGKNSSYFHLNAELKNKEEALMDSFDYLKYFLDRVDGQNRFKNERKSTIVKILVAKEIITARTSWLDQFSDDERLEIYLKISADDKVLKPALILGVADILSHKGDSSWILKKPKLNPIKSNLNPNQDFMESNNGKTRLDFLLESFGKFSKMKLTDHDVQNKANKSFNQDFQELYDLMLKYSKKKPKYTL